MRAKLQSRSAQATTYEETDAEFLAALPAFSGTGLVGRT